jgi:branched-chain amino acid transport system ATP-binding protein
MTTMLEVKNLSVRYGRHHALDHVSVKVDKGEICVILGANGAGKSSLLKAIAGTVRVEPGSEIVMNGKTITGMKAHLIVEEGVALVPEGRGIFGELTVAENLELGSFPNRARAREKATLEQIYKLFPRLAERKSQIARTMSGGEQQMVAIGRALMSQPEILMLDEPSLGLSPVLTKELFRSLAKIAETGVGILLVEQNARQSLKIANRGYLIEVGRITGEGTAQSLMTDPAVVNAYLGGARGGAKARATTIRLPGPFPLPLDLASVGRFIGALALRAGAIRTAFVQALRQASPLPSAFAGRYDPKKAGDPWDIASATSRVGSPGASIAPDGKRLADHAAELAKAASLRHARHIRWLRASRDNPSAFVGVYDPATALIEADALDPAVLARAASVRMAEHIRQRRLAAPVPSAFLRKDERRSDEERKAERDGLLGHNSRGVDIDAEEPALAASPQPGRALDIDALVSRAATIQAQHVAARRKRLTMVKVKPGDLPGNSGPDTK